MTRAIVAAGGVILVVLIAAGVFFYWYTAAPSDERQTSRTSEVPPQPPLTANPMKSQPIGMAIAAAEHPQVAHVRPVDLDADGLMDVIACDALRHRVVWIRQFPRGAFTETALGDIVMAPAHAEPVDLDRDGDLDLLVASLGVLFPSNAKIGAVVVLENDGRGRFSNRVLVDKIARVADARAGDLDGDGDLDIAVAQFGYNEGQTRWMRNDGAWRFSSTILQNLSGPINVEIRDLDGDRDLDIASLVSQEWEEIYAYINDGRGRFEARLIWGSTNDDFGSSWLTAADLDQDGDIDFVYSNGDAFDYATGGGRPWHGVQWIENLGALAFQLHRIADYSGAASPQPVDLDQDGDLDVAVVSSYNNWDSPSAHSLILLVNDGRMQFTRRDLANAPTHLITLGAADFTGDGYADLVTGGMHTSRPYDRLSRVTLWTNGSPATPR